MRLQRRARRVSMRGRAGRAGTRERVDCARCGALADGRSCADRGLAARHAGVVVVQTHAPARGARRLARIGRAAVVGKGRRRDGRAWRRRTWRGGGRGIGGSILTANPADPADPRAIASRETTQKRRPLRTRLGCHRLVAGRGGRCIAGGTRLVHAAHKGEHVVVWQWRRGTKELLHSIGACDLARCTSTGRA